MSEANTHTSVTSEAPLESPPAAALHGLRDRTQPQRSGLKLWLLLTTLVVCAVVLLSVLEWFVTQRVTSSVLDTEHMGVAWEIALATWGPWVLLAPGIAWLAFWVPPGRGRWLAFVATQAVGAVLIAVLVMLAEGVLLQAMGWEIGLDPETMVVVMPDSAAETEMPEMTEVVEVMASMLGDDGLCVWCFFQNLMRFMTFSAVALVPALALRSGDRERSELDMQRELAATENRLLRAQLQPHFLFNSLNGIHVLIREDPDRAREIVQRLSGLLRATLQESQLVLLPLAREIAVLRDYLELEDLRFGDRVQFELEVDPECEQIMVPSFCIQPLVENSLRHGPGSQPGGGTISIRVKRSGDHLLIRVADDGPGMVGPGPRRGYGLGVTERRLQRLFAGRATMAIDTSTDGFVVELLLPCDASLADAEGGR